ncbi:MAG: zinc metallopeptidase [Verrucomicrobiae bacterium]|nr:zinc metallopeptidase [Verrucomicrobiae bacterium]
MQLFLLLFIVVLALTMWVRGKFRKAYDEELKNIAASGLTGAELARRILMARGIEVVEIVRGRGLFADFYDPARKRLTLAPQHFSGSTYAALGIAAHEAGHVLQHREGHHPLHWRVSAIRATMWLSLPLVVLGLLMIILPGFGKTGVMVLCAGWSMVAGYNLLTLPVELDATERVRRVIDEMRPKPFSCLEEKLGVERMMRAASAAHVDGVFNVISWLGSWFLPAAEPKKD